MPKLGSLTNQSIRTRIVLALSIPTIAFIALGVMHLLERRQAAAEMANIEHLTGFAQVISELVHEMQKERGASAGFTGSGGAKFGDTLRSQRTLSNAKLAAFANARNTFKTPAQPPEFTKLIADADAKLEELGKTRSAIDSLSLDAGGVTGYYTSTISALLTAIEHIALLTTNAELTNMIMIYTSFLQAKERAGQERAVGSAGFSAGVFAPPIYRRFIELLAEQRAYFNRFATYATGAQRSLLAGKIPGPLAQDIARMEAIAVESPQTGNTGDVNAAHWFKTLTAKIDLLKEVEDSIASSLRNRASELGEAANRSFTIIAALAVLSLIIGGGTVYVTVRGILRPVEGMTTSHDALGGWRCERRYPRDRSAE